MTLKGRPCQKRISAEAIWILVPMVRKLGYQEKEISFQRNLKRNSIVIKKWLGVHVTCKKIR
jgi:hypothetical protein